MLISFILLKLIFCKLIFKTSSAEFTGVILISSITFFGISTKFFSLSFGINTCLIKLKYLYVLLKVSMNLIHQLVKLEFVVIVTSPVIAISLLTGILVINETIDVTISIDSSRWTIFE